MCVGWPPLPLERRLAGHPGGSNSWQEEERRNRSSRGSRRKSRRRRWWEGGRRTAVRGLPPRSAAVCSLPTSSQFSSFAVTDCTNLIIIITNLPLNITIISFACFQCAKANTFHSHKFIPNDAHVCTVFFVIRNSNILHSQISFRVM